VLLLIIGVIDTVRAQRIIENLLAAVVRTESRVAIIDVTGVPVIDTMVAHHLLKMVAAAKMLGTQVLLAGISPEIAQTLVKLRIDLGDLHCSGTLRAAMAEALLAVGLNIST
jgi:rsbT co-antagonist protein RsbR